MEKSILLENAIVQDVNNHSHDSDILNVDYFNELSAKYGLNCDGGYIFEGLNLSIREQIRRLADRQTAAGICM